MKQGGAYAVWGRVYMPDGGSDSLYVSMDQHAAETWATREWGKWVWLKLKKRHELEPGERILRVRTREAGARLDRVVITNDSTFAPGR